MQKEILKDRITQPANDRVVLGRAIWLSLVWKCARFLRTIIALSYKVNITEAWVEESQFYNKVGTDQLAQPCSRISTLAVQFLLCI